LISLLGIALFDNSSKLFSFSIEQVKGLSKSVIPKSDIKRDSKIDNRLKEQIPKNNHVLENQTLENEKLNKAIQENNKNEIKKPIIKEDLQDNLSSGTNVKVANVKHTSTTEELTIQIKNLQKNEEINKQINEKNGNDKQIQSKINGRNSNINDHTDQKIKLNLIIKENKNVEKKEEFKKIIYENKKEDIVIDKEKDNGNIDPVAKCPNCRQMIYFEGGCRFITCQSNYCKSNKYFCIICGSSLNKTDKMSHFIDGLYANTCMNKRN